MNRCVNSEYLTTNLDKIQTAAFAHLAIQGTRESAL